MSDTFVRIHLDVRRKLRYKHKDLRDAVAESGKSIGELLTDAFGGWPYLLRMGLRWNDLKISVDKASEFIDLWCENPDPDALEAWTKSREAGPKPPNRTLDQMGMLLLEALNASGFVKIVPDTPLDEGEDTPEGNAKPEAAAIRTE